MHHIKHKESKETTSFFMIDVTARCKADESGMVWYQSIRGVRLNDSKMSRRTRGSITRASDRNKRKCRQNQSKAAGNTGRVSNSNKRQWLVEH